MIESIDDIHEFGGLKVKTAHIMMLDHLLEAPTEAIF